MNFSELNLTRPLAVLDVETTGLSFEHDRIIQIAITLHYADTRVVEWKSYINPGVPIPPESGKITDAMVADAPPFAFFAEKLARTALGAVDYAGYNVLFDLRMIRAEMKRAKVGWDWEQSDSHVIDAHRIAQIKQPMSLSDEYERHAGEKLDGAHDAGADVYATRVVLTGQLAKYPDLPRSVPALAAFCFPVKAHALDSGRKFTWRHNEVCFAFGKWQSQPVKDHLDYLRWMVSPKGMTDLPADTRRLALSMIAGQFPMKQETV